MTAPTSMTAVVASPLAAPLEPGADDARRSLVEELTKPEYLAAQPTWLDRLAQAFNEWLNGLSFGDVEGAPALALLVVALAVVVVIVVVLVVYGAPRLNRRSARESVLFGDDDDRASDAMRASAAAAASAGDFSTAIVERFRAVARLLAERGDLTTTPGTTARAVGERAGELFEPLATEFAFSARAFDEVRYLDRVGSDEAYRRIEALDTTVRSRRAVVRS